MQNPKSPNVQWHQGGVTRAQREQQRGQRGATVWFTGLSGSGKSSVAHAVERTLLDMGAVAYVLDGDNVRHGLNGDLGFSPDDRKENIRRIGEVAKLFTDAGVIVLCAFVSPYRQDRDRIREILDKGDFIEVHVAASLQECERRDTKGLYKRARSGDIQDLTGVTAPYEPPLSPELVLNTEVETLPQSTGLVVNYLIQGQYLLATKS